MRPPAKKLDQLFKLLRLYDPALAHDFATLSKVLPTSRGEDTLVDRFVRGKALSVLFDHCVAVVGALPVDESVVELMFSEGKKYPPEKRVTGADKP